MTARLRPLLCLWLIVACAAAKAGVDGERALDLIRQQCAQGPRIPGTAAHKATAEWIRGQLRGMKYVVRDQPFTARLELIQKSAPAVNIYGLPAEDGPTSPAIIISAHWDTRPIADRDPSKTNPPMPGANDGASGVALALEVARALSASPLRQHVALLLHDAEDSGVEGRNSSYCRGAYHAAAHPPAWISRVRAGLNFDMVAGAEVVFVPDALSLRAAPGPTRRFWEIGMAFTPQRFNPRESLRTMDDHMPWIEAGVPWVNLLGLPWPYWHTAGDAPENCSAATLQAVGDVTLEWLRGELRGQSK